MNPINPVSKIVRDGEDVVICRDAHSFINACSLSHPYSLLLRDMCNDQWNLHGTVSQHYAFDLLFALTTRAPKNFMKNCERFVIMSGLLCYTVMQMILQGYDLYVMDVFIDAYIELL